MKNKKWLILIIIGIILILSALSIQIYNYYVDERAGKESKEVVEKIHKELKETSNITMVIVTHDMDFAHIVSDKVLFMSEGKVCEFGTPDEVFKNPKSEALKVFLENPIE